MKYFAYFFAGAFSLAVILVAVFWAGAQISLDRSFTHSQETAELRYYENNVSDGLVRVETKRGVFRARVGGFGEQGDRPLVVLLHGFPVTSAMWLDLIPPLVNAGYRVVAFDQRGYSPQIRPQAVSQYAVSEMVDDVFAMVEAIGSKQFHLVGHDWGAAVGWGAVLAKPDQIISWTPLSIAHPAAFGAALQNDPDQQSKSSYFSLFSASWIPETLFSFNQFAALKAIYGNMRAEKVDEYINVFREPGALTAALNWYRAMAIDTQIGDQSMEVTVPTLFIWGNQDDAVGRLGTELMADYMKGPYSIIELDAGHWLLSEKPEQVIGPVVGHIQGNAGS